MRRIFLAASSLLFAGCSPQVDIHALRMAELSTFVSEAVEAGPVAIRYNPTDCDCPPFEIQAGALWVRMALLPSSQDEDPLARFTDRCAKELASGSITKHTALIALESKRPDFTRNGTPFFKGELVLADPPTATTEEQ